MFNKAKKIKENAEKATEAAKQATEEAKNAMQELGDDELGAVSGAGDPFASRPRVTNKNLNDSVRNKG